ncbi:MAG: helix-turn-helix domain-containing protein, partial [Tepidiformaceae bacterium]
VGVHSNFNNGHALGPDAPNLSAPSPLSPREREVVALMAVGKTNAQIADALVVSPATASRHVHNILTKLGISRRGEAVAYAVAEGIISLQELLARPALVDL